MGNGLAGTWGTIHDKRSQCRVVAQEVLDHMSHNCANGGPKHSPPRAAPAKQLRKQLTKRPDTCDRVECGEEYREGFSERYVNATENQEEESMVSGTMNNASNSAHVPAARQMCSPSPNPLVQKRLLNKMGKSGGEDLILEIMKVSMLQEQKRRETEPRRYLDEQDAEMQRREEERSYCAQRIEEERLGWEEERERRKEDGKRFEEERRCNNQMMHMMMMVLLGQENKGFNPSGSSR